MNVNPDQNQTNFVGTRTPAVRAALAGIAVAGFLILGFLFLHSMKMHDWTIAILSVVGGLSVIPWASHRSSARDCWTGTVSLAAGALCGIGAVMIYLGMFHFEWFSEIFNHKETGPIGMSLFAALGFGVGGYATLLTLIWCSLPTSTSVPTLFTSCFKTTSSQKAR